MQTILMITSHLSIGGAEKVLVKQVEILRNSGYIPVIICTDVYGKFGDYLQALDFDVIDISSFPKRRKKIDFVIETIYRYRPAIVFISNSEFSEALERTKAELQYSVVLQAHGCLKLPTSFTHKLFKHYDGLLDLVILTHPRALVAAAESYSFSKVLMPNPVDRYFFQYPFSASKKNIVGFCGRISQEKSLISFARICGILKKTIPDLKALIVGDADEHYIKCINYKNKVMSAFEKEDVELTISGHRVFCASALEQARVSVQLSVTEGYGNSVWESLALGIPVVSLDVGASYLALEKKESGFLVPWDWQGDSYEVPERLYHELAARIYTCIKEPYNPQSIREVALPTHEDKYAEQFMDVVDSLSR